jgi:hypothetical protein
MEITLVFARPLPRVSRPYRLIGPDARPWLVAAAPSHVVTGASALAKGTDLLVLCVFTPRVWGRRYW